MGESGRLAVFAAPAANLGIAASRFVAFAFTGSSAMPAEGVHSTADSCNQILLLVGGRRARPGRGASGGLRRVAMLLGAETRSLLIGESATDDVLRLIEGALVAEPGVRRVRAVVGLECTVYLEPDIDRGPSGQDAVQPPSIAIDVPVTNDAPSEHR